LDLAGEGGNVSAKALTTEELAERLRAACSGRGRQTVWAKVLGVDQGQLSRIVKGQESLSDNIAIRMGYEKRWVPIDPRIDGGKNEL